MEDKTQSLLFRIGSRIRIRDEEFMATVAVADLNQACAEIVRLRAEVKLQVRQMAEFAERSGDDINTLRAEVERLEQVRDAAEAYMEELDHMSMCGANECVLCNRIEALCAALATAKRSKLTTVADSL